MRSRFGDSYEAYARHVRRLVPYIVDGRTGTPSELLASVRECAPVPLGKVRRPRRDHPHQRRSGITPCAGSWYDAPVLAFFGRRRSGFSAALAAFTVSSARHPVKWMGLGVQTGVAEHLHHLHPPPFRHRRRTWTGPIVAQFQRVVLSLGDLLGTLLRVAGAAARGQEQDKHAGEQQGDSLHKCPFSDLSATHHNSSNGNPKKHRREPPAKLPALPYSRSSSPVRNAQNGPTTRSSALAGLCNVHDVRPTRSSACRHYFRRSRRTSSPRASPQFGTVPRISDAPPAIC